MLRMGKRMKFCSQCGTEVERLIPEGDNRQRHVCPECRTIHYQNPKMVVGCIPLWEEQVLLCRRAIEPRYGLWTLPAGFMENGETAQQGAARETWEEAQARVEMGELYTLFNLPHIDQVYLLFLSRLQSLDFGPGSESLEVALFDESEIPWDELAFPVVKETLKLFFADRSTDSLRLRSGSILRVSEHPRRYRTEVF
ncbi:ADP-ribose pyrophosphatase YjhB, NUDIX family [endosymbiont of Ridgeia piscesae]|nr:ADP-ribose pyrophosphatase YjhB, NUDIX family [endosymbiont of Ridgeia piscesae]